MYTLKVKFQNTPNAKIYHYASINFIDPKLNSFVSVSTPNGPEDVILVDCVHGISLNATKWKSGGLISQEQRDRYGVKPKSFEHEVMSSDTGTDDLDKSTVARELALACYTFKKYASILKDNGLANGLGFSQVGNLCIQVSTETPRTIQVSPSRLPTNEWVQEVAALICNDGKEVERQRLIKELDEIKAKARSVADQIANL